MLAGGDAVTEAESLSDGGAVVESEDERREREQDERLREVIGRLAPLSQERRDRLALLFRGAA
ncbi:hypothetical protein GCM10010439_60670 [Actinocorallia aurantiaca]|uniref:Uncharacterized protein n=1 Tax=Actinocorallia aurantiaca TaxID=46204 RepID=A0ABN3UMJ4_9ACTN